MNNSAYSSQWPIGETKQSQNSNLIGAVVTPCGPPKFCRCPYCKNGHHLPSECPQRIQDSTSRPDYRKAWICTSCKRAGHIAETCRNPSPIELLSENVAALTQCQGCNEYGHKRMTCLTKPYPPREMQPGQAQTPNFVPSPNPNNPRPIPIPTNPVHQLTTSDIRSTKKSLDPTPYVFKNPGGETQIVIPNKSKTSENPTNRIVTEEEENIIPISQCKAYNPTKGVRLDIKHGKSSVSWEIDTGARLSIMRMSTFKQIVNENPQKNFFLKQTKTKFRTANNTPIHCYGKV